MEAIIGSFQKCFDVLLWLKTDFFISFDFLSSLKCGNVEYFEYNPNLIEVQ